MDKSGMGGNGEEQDGRGWRRVGWEGSGDEEVWDEMERSGMRWREVGGHGGMG